MSFNHFRNKRQAHAISPWNPFAQISRSNTLRRAGTWDGPQVEAGSGTGTDAQDLSVLSATASAPYAGPSDYAAATSRPAQGVPVVHLSPPPVEGDGIEAAEVVGAQRALGTDDDAPKRTDTIRSTAAAEGPGPKKRLWLFKQVEPRAPFTIGGQLRRLYRLSIVMKVLLLCCPVGFCLNFTNGPSIETFIINFISTIPINFLGDFAMTEIGLRLGELTADLLSVSTREITVLQTSLVGSILANVLFLLGMSIICGCHNRPYQNLNRTAAHMASNLLCLSSTSLLVPTASRLLSQASPEDLLKQSRGASVVLLVVYGSFVFCEHWTHRQVFGQEAEKVPTRDSGASQHAVRRGLGMPGSMMGLGVPDRGENERLSNMLMYPPRVQPEAEEGGEDSEGPQLRCGVALGIVAMTTTLLYFHIDFTVKSIDAVTASARLSRTFVGLILFPLSSCDYVPMALAMKDKLGHTVTSTVGKSIQTALLVTPTIVLLAWCLGVDQVTLVFDGFEVVSLFATVLLLNFLIVDARVHWVQGVLLLADWGLIAIAAFFVTEKDARD
ncbi:DDHD domain-containing protein [Purpureocillium lavendulum]|uniref:DDHD domain-containing protein n=1 Tax=Purpureocillium lavendulum TaxID=1247861 RepID=A0AB34FVP0_9HYPO|nr:DDHD domain-containing protein [Purpureocillium lavendulum]